MRAVDGYNADNISSTGDQVVFPLTGGRYGITVIATFGGGSVTLERLAGDGATWVTAATAITANGFAAVELPRGSYRFTVATATAVYVGIERIPGE
jgi:hypothetical protein